MFRMDICKTKTLTTKLEIMVTDNITNTEKNHKIARYIIQISHTIPSKASSNNNGAPTSS